MPLQTTDSAPVRLRSSNAITAVLRSGRRRAVGTVVVHVAPNERGDVRVAAVASRRVGDAVRRNRAKRLIREAVRATSWRPGIDAVVVARPSIVGVGMATVQADVRAAGDKLGVLA